MTSQQFLENVCILAQRETGTVHVMVSSLLVPPPPPISDGATTGPRERERRKTIML